MFQKVKSFLCIGASQGIENNIYSFWADPEEKKQDTKFMPSKLRAINYYCTFKTDPTKKQNYILKNNPKSMSNSLNEQEIDLIVIQEIYH